MQRGLSLQSDETHIGHQKTASPGVLFVGLQILVISLLINPHVIQKVFPLHLLSNPAAWYFTLFLHFFGVVLGGAFIYRWRQIGQSGKAQFVFERIPILGGILLSLGTLLVLLSLLEVLFWQLRIWHGPSPRVPRVEARREGKIVMDDYLLGYRGIPCSKGVHRATILPGEALLFEATYSLDEYGFRVVPQPNGAKSAHLAMFGCSFTFGEGVNDDEALPAQLACLRPDMAVYSFAMQGYGPGQAALQIQTGVTDRIEEPLGAAVYLFIGDHLNRLVAYPEYVGKWMAQHPAFVLDDRAQPVYRGGIRDVFADELSCYAFLSRENFVRWSGLRFPLALRQRDYELGAALLDVARREYQVRFPGNAFYVLLDPSADYRFDLPRFKAALKRCRLDILDATGLYAHAAGENPFYYRIDMHPRPEAHAMLAEWFWKQFPDGLLAGPRKVEE